MGQSRFIPRASQPADPTQPARVSLSYTPTPPVSLSPSEPLRALSQSRGTHPLGHRLQPSAETRVFMAITAPLIPLHSISLVKEKKTPFLVPYHPHPLHATRPLSHDPRSPPEPDAVEVASRCNQDAIPSPLFCFVPHLVAHLVNLFVCTLCPQDVVFFIDTAAPPQNPAPTSNSRR